MFRNPTPLRAVLLAGSAALASSPTLAQQLPPNDAAATAAPGTTPADTQTQAAEQPTTPPGAQPPAGADTSFQEIVVTGNTSGKRTLFDSSSNVTLANSADLVRKAPRSTAETLELVPGIFVEGTAGPISNNYSVRGLRGGSQQFITLEEDGLPILYQGSGADFYFQNDITVDKLEAVEGGTSGVLAPNGAGATINFISLKPNFDKPTASVRFTGTTYGDYRADGYFSAPITDGLAFNVGGYVVSQKGVRRNPFSYNAYNIQSQLQKKFDDGGYVRLSIRRGDQHNPFYADMPFAVSAGGKISSLPGLNLKTDDILGKDFANFAVPSAPETGNSIRNFRGKSGIHVTSTVYRIDVDKPITDGVRLFARARYLDGKYDFNGIFPGSGSGTAGLTSARTYLDPTASPLASLKPIQGSPLSYFQVAQQRFPGVAQYGLRRRDGTIIPASNTAALDALNGNGLLQQTILNHQTLATKDFGSDFGGKWDYDTGNIDNSLTVGGQYYNVRRRNDQSATTTVLNDVTNGSHVYDLVALDGGGNVLGQLTNDGMVNYGNWGQGIFKDEVNSISGYFNDELKVGEKLHIDFGARYEHQHVRVDIGNQAAVNAPVPTGTPGLYQDVGATFDGSYTRGKATYHDWAYTAGVNYTLTDHLALYARGAHGFQTNGGDTGGTKKPTGLTLYEGGVRVQYPWLAASVIGFRTVIKNQSFQFINPDNPTIQGNAVADSKTNGVQVDADIRPVRFFSVNVTGVYQDPKISNLAFDQPIAGDYAGNTPERTPKKLLTVTPAFILPSGLGEVYGRWKYIGRIFADAGNGIALPSYSVFTVGASVNATSNINISVSVDNLTNAKGFTEGNPRQGQTQTITNGTFYGRAIVGRNALVAMTVKL